MRELLQLFSHPSHYVGIEDGICKKKDEDIRLRIGLAFPDKYEVGMSYLGQKILYNIVNKVPGWQAERVMEPDIDVMEILRGHNVELATLETDTPLSRLAAVCFSVTHELCYTDILNMLDLGHIPLRSCHRSEDLGKCPVIMAGGGAMLGAEPLSPFIDLVALGDGEEIFPEILRLLEWARAENLGRSSFLEKAAHIAGVYVPSLFEESLDGSLKPVKPGYSPCRRIVTDLENVEYPASQVAPVGAVHNRLTLEIARGCSRGCRFCHAGMMYRPVRERKPESVGKILNQCLDSTGYDEVSFLALSAGDVTGLKSIFNAAHERCSREQVSLALPSLRVGSVDDEIMEKMAALRRTGFTLAPEAGSQRLRDVINKGITEEELLVHLQKIIEHGWRQVKLYFMIGLPTETDEDLLAIAELCKKARFAGGPGAPRLQVTAAISPFVPKPFTPFQWEAQADREEICRRINYLRALFKGQKSLALKWHDPDVSHLEGILSRGDRKLANVIEKAWAKGAIFCSWAEHFKLEPWLEALRECDLAAEEYTGSRNLSDPLPWSHIESGISNQFLLHERKKAYEGRITADCRKKCSGCGVCDTSSSSSRLAKTSTEISIGHLSSFSQRDQSAHTPARDVNGQLILRNGCRERPKLNPKLAVKAVTFRIWHSKMQGAAFISNLELQAILSRAFRRARLPLSFSQGFHPMPLMSFGRALPVGVESEAEWFCVTFYERMAPDKIARKIKPFLQPQLAISHIEISGGEKKIEPAISENFRLEFANLEQFLWAKEQFTDFFACEEFLFSRETKKGQKIHDLRAMLLKWASWEDTNQITFSADWLLSYISPLVLVRQILKTGNQEQESSFARLVKTGQVFSNGAVYGMSGLVQ